MKLITKLSIFLFLIATCSFSYGQMDQKSGLNESSKSDSVKNKTLNIGPVTTALTIDPLKAYPPFFVLDSINSEDTTVNYTIRVYFPKSINNAEFNKSIKLFVEHRVNMEKPQEKTIDNCSFDMWVTDFKISGHLIQYVFREQSVTEGAAHYNHGYSIYNYDSVRKKRIVFTDIFIFSKNKDKQSFCNQVNNYINGDDNSNSSNSELIPEQINRELNYEISNKQLVIYPNYCCAEENTIFKVDLQLLQDYRNPNIDY